MTAPQIIHRAVATRPVGPPLSLDEERRTVRVCWLSTPDVPRAQWDGSQVIERLSPENCDLSRLNSGTAPVTDSHMRVPMSAQVGVVLRAWFERGQGLAEIRISDRPEVAGLWRDIVAGVVRNVSLEAEVESWIETPATKTSPRVLTAAAWRPLAISFVTVPADPGAVTRSKEEASMEQNVISPAGVEPVKPATITREQEAAEIRRISAPFARSLPAGFVDDLVARGIGLNEARTAILDRLAQESERTPIHSTNPIVTMGRDRRDGLVERMAEALACRYVGKAPSDGAREFWGASVTDLAREILTVNGLSAPRWDRGELLKRAMHTTSDFPNLLTGTGQRMLLEAYQAAAPAIKQIARRSTAVDFRAKSVLQLGEAPKLIKVNEAGEIKYGSRAEAKESYRLYTYARIFSISREALINDDLGAFSDFTRAYGVAAANLEAQVLVDLLVGSGGLGPVMRDGQTLFHATHGNLAASGGAISDTTLTAARLALRTMKGLDGETIIEVSPRYLVTPAAKETEGQKAIAAIYPATTATANVFTNALTLVTDPRLDAKSATRWYVFGDPAVAPVLEYSYLQDAQGPTVDTRPGFDVLGMEFRAVLDFGAGALDWRGAYCNPGA
ncbi:MAG: prohead protease/major capsid protein fusion protein [Rhodospirillales bacterium]